MLVCLFFFHAGPEWQATISALVEAVIKFEMLSVSASNQVSEVLKMVMFQQTQCFYNAGQPLKNIESIPRLCCTLNRSQQPLGHCCRL